MPPEIMPTDIIQPNFSVIIPEPWTLANQSKEDKDKIRDEVMDKTKTWENRMSSFFEDYQSYADSWRVKSRKQVKKGKGLYNSKSGESHRAGETLGSFWLRSLTAQDPYFEAVGDGRDDYGNEIDEGQLYASERVITKQLRVSHYKEKLMRALRSVAVFGTAIFEEPFVRVPWKNGTAVFEYTDFVFRSLLKTAFDTGVWDVNLSDFIATIDFPDKYLLKRWAKSDTESWNNELVGRYLSDIQSNGYDKNGVTANKSTGAWNRVNESKTRAGYTEIDNNVFEFISYHGKLDSENSVIASLWESQERTDDPADFDFSPGVLSGEHLVRFHETQFGTWHSRFKVAHFKTFEDEPMGYGSGRIGRKGQREIDVTLSRASDTMMKGVYSMYLVGRYAGVKANQWGINPNGLIEVEDVDQVKPLPIDVTLIAQAMAMVADRREEYRSTVGAHTNLQAQITKASATESAIAQNEAVRGASVHAELIAETFLREHIETMHYNNLQYLDEPIWVAATGERKPGYYDKDTLPKNIGIEIRIVTDRNFRPERLVNIMKGLELSSSIRNVFDPMTTINLQKTLVTEYFRGLDIDPRQLKAPVSVREQLMLALSKSGNQGQGLGNEVEGEAAGAVAGDGGNNEIATPVGPVATSPMSVEPITPL